MAADWQTVHFGWPGEDSQRLDRLQWRTALGTPKERRYVRVAGVAPDVDIVPFNNSLNTLLRAVTERVFLVKDGQGGFCAPPRPSPGIFSSRLSSVRQKLLKYLPSTAPCSHQQFVDGYSGRKKVAYQRALDEIRAGRFTPEEDASVKAFIKFEKTDRTTKMDPVPRVISPRNPRFNIKVGRYLSPLEHRIFKSLSRLFPDQAPTVMKGLNAEASARALRAKWDHFNDPVAVGLDASRFDQHVSSDALKWEHDIYVNCFHGKHRDRLAKLLSYQLVNHCFGSTPDGDVKYVIEGTRMSGDMNTSLGNCVLMCSMIRAYLDARGVEGALANNGDDCVVFMERRDLARFSNGLGQWFNDMGFNMVVEAPVDEFEQVEFCQTHPVFDGETWIMCRNPLTAIPKDSVMLKCFDNDKIFKGWLDAVGTGGLSLTGGLPVFQAMYSAYVRSGRKRPIPQELLPWSFRNLTMGMRRQPGFVRPEARFSFWLAFGVTPDEQCELEKYYQRLTIHGVPGPYQARPIFQ
jgi:hypothetical protein